MNDSKIFIIVEKINGDHIFPTDIYNCIALAEDGTIIDSHICSSVDWAKSDMGITSNNKHGSYKKHYPTGYELIWLQDEEIANNNEFQNAWKKQLQFKKTDEN